MTRVFRPAQPIGVECAADGRPRRVRARGDARVVTRIARTWTQHALWLDHGVGDRVYYRVLLDGIVPWDIYQAADGGWFVERIIT